MGTSAPLRLALPLVLACGLLAPGGSPAFGEDPAKPAPTDAGMGGDGGGAEPAVDPLLDDPLNDAELVGPLKDRINKAIDKAVPWLLSRQKGDGSWGALDVDKMGVYGGKGGKPYSHPAGFTALALYTLLKCKYPPDHPQVKKGFAWLDKHHRRPQGSYETAVALLAVCATADPNKSTKMSERKRGEIREKLSGPNRKWAQDLVEHLKRKHEGRRGWRYQIIEGTAKATRPEHNGNEDSSSTQLVALSLFAADRCGIAVPSQIWHDILGFALDQMEDDGPLHDRAVYSSKEVRKEGDAPVKDKARGSAYMKKSPDAEENSAYGSVTACGLASLQIARFVLEQKGDPKWKKDEALRQRVQTAIYDSVAWIDLNWKPFSNPRHANDRHPSYWLYSVERGMDLIGAKRLGGKMWYQAMAEQWLGRQSDKGSWDSNATYPPSDLMDTCWVLLFLRRSTSGVIEYPDITDISNEPPVDRRGEK
jgi:hypothetical protein